MKDILFFQAFACLKEEEFISVPSQQAAFTVSMFKMLRNKFESRSVVTDMRGISSVAVLMEQSSCPMVTGLNEFNVDSKRMTSIKQHLSFICVTL